MRKAEQHSRRLLLHASNARRNNVQGLAQHYGVFYDTNLMRASGTAVATSLLVVLNTAKACTPPEHLRLLVTIQAAVKSSLATPISHTLLFKVIDCIYQNISPALMAPTLKETLVTMASIADSDGMKTLLGEHESPSEETIQKLLVAAAKSENLQAINFLLNQGSIVPLNEEIFRGAVNTGSIPVTKALLARDPAIINMPFDHRGSALIVACMGRQNIEYLRFLLEAGADPNMDPDAAAYPLVLVASLYTDPDAVDVLVKHGAHLDGTGALACAAQKGKEAMVLRLLEFGARPDDQAKRYRTYGGIPLHGAVSHGHEGVVRALLQHGADPHVTDHNGSTAMEVAKQMELDGKDVSNILEVLENHGRNASSRVQTQ